MMTTKTSKRWPLLFLGITLVTLVLLSAGLSRFELLPGKPFPYRLLFGDSEASDTSVGSLAGVPASFIEFLALLSMCFLILVLVLWLITFILKPDARKHMLRRIISQLVLLVLIYILLDYFRRLAPAPDEEAADSIGRALTEIGPPLEELPTPPAFIVDPPVWVATLVTLILASLFLGALWFLWRRRAASVPASSPPAPSERLAQEAQQALEQLNRGHDFKNSVLSCYLAMSQVLKEQRGIERDRGMTARDFERYLADLGLRDEHIQRLTRLFEKVRYGAHTPAEKEEAEAIDCLSAIVEAYGRTA